MTAGKSYAQQTPGQLFEKALYAEEVEGDLAEAIVLYQQVLEENPDDRQLAARAILHKGLCYEKLGSEQARQSYYDVLSKYSEQAEEADIARERMTSLDAYVAELNIKAEQHMKQGNELFKMWAYEDAIKEYEDAITLRPNTLLAMNAQYSIGHSLYRAGKYEDALTTFTNLMEENPESNIAPVTELMVSQVQYAMENNENPGITKIISDENTIVDPETGITYRKIKTFTGESDIITNPVSLKLSPNGKHLLCGNTVVPMDGTAPFELIDYHSTGIQAHRGIWSPNGTQAAFYSEDALCVVPVSPETGHTTGPFKKIIDVELKYSNHPGWSPDGKKLTYKCPGGDLWTIDADGNNLRQITKSDIREVGPAWSPDGKTIAYGTVQRHVKLYDIEKDKSSEFIDAGFRCYPVWAPDGKWILGNEYGKLHFYNLNDKSNFELATLKEVGTFFSWLQENNRMLFFRTSYHSAAVQKIASSKGGPSFEPVPLLINWGRAEWSENNNLIAVLGEDEKGEIAFSIVPLMGGESFLLNLDHLIDGKPFPFKISSGLEILLFNVDRDDGKEDLYAVPVSAEDARTTGPAVKIFKGWYREGGFDTKISLSPNGEKVALIQEDKIWIAFTNGDNPIRIDKITEEVGYLRWAPDGKTLLFLTPSGWSLLENPGPQGRIVRLVHEGKGIECSWRNIDISPDSKQFAVLSDDQIKITPFDETKSIKILDFSDLALKSSMDLKWSPDGKSLAFVGMKETDDSVLYPEGKHQILNFPVNGGPPIRVAEPDPDWKAGLSWSPDGKWIAYTTQKSVKLRPESTMWEADFEEIKEKLVSHE